MRVSCFHNIVCNQPVVEVVLFEAYPVTYFHQPPADVLSVPGAAGGDVAGVSSTESGTGSTALSIFDAVVLSGARSIIEGAALGAPWSIFDGVPLGDPWSSEILMPVPGVTTGTATGTVETGALGPGVGDEGAEGAVPEAGVFLSPGQSASRHVPGRRATGRSQVALSITPYPTLHISLYPRHIMTRYPPAS